MIPVKLDLYAQNGALLASSYRSFVLPYRSTLLRWMDTLAFAVPLLLGLRTQAAVVEARCAPLCLHVRAAAR
jgi:hypothetical protein